MEDRTGQQFGNYTLLHLLGQGGFADVYLAEHKHLGTHAAVKLLRTYMSQGESDIFRKEARIIARLIHPNIIRIFDFDIQNTTPFLVMDYCPGSTLRQLHRRSQPVPLPTVVKYINQVADALQYAHDEKVIHRDVKPENLLLGRRGEILLSDFGIAILTQTSRSMSTQAVEGTAVYMAPEQFQGRPAPASDQYALAIVAFEWLTGNVPFKGSFTEVIAQHLLQTPDTLKTRLASQPSEVQQVLLKALSKQPEDRYPRIIEFAEALAQAAKVAESKLTEKATNINFLNTVIEKDDTDKHKAVQPKPSSPSNGDPAQLGQRHRWRGEGEVFYAMKDYKQAIESFDRALAIDPQYSDVHALKGDAYYMLRDYQKAYEAYEQANQTGDHSAETYKAKGVTLYYLQRDQEALTALDKAIALNPGFASAYDWRGVVLAVFKRYEEALAAREKAIALGTEASPTYLGKGIALYYLKRDEEALIAVERAIQLDPSSYNAQCWKGDICNILKRYTDANIAYEKALALGDTRAEVYLAKGKSLFYLARYQEALEHFNQALNLKPDYASAHTWKGDTLEKLGRQSEAQIAHQRGSELGSNVNHVNKGIELYDAGKYEESLVLFDKAILSNPKDALAYSWRGAALGRLKRYAEALPAREKAIQLGGPTSADCLGKAIALYHLNRPGEALVAVDQVFPLDPKSANAYTWKGDILTKLGRHSEAQAAYDRAAELGDTSGPINKGIALYDANKFEEALQVFEQVVKSNPTNSLGYSWKGATLGQLKRYAEALPAREKAIQLGGPTTMDCLGKGIALYYLKRYDEAISAFNEVLKLDINHSLAYDWQGAAYYQVERYSEALFARDKALQLGSQSAITHLGKGQALYSLGRYDESLTCFDKAIELDPEYSSSYTWKAMAIRKINERG